MPTAGAIRRMTESCNVQGKLQLKSRGASKLVMSNAWPLSPVERLISKISAPEESLLMTYLSRTSFKEQTMWWLSVAPIRSEYLAPVDWRELPKIA